MLATSVEAGKLPPVDERLPENPSVYPVQEMIGKYGGTIRRGFSGVSDSTGPSKVRDCSLSHYNPDLTLRPNLAESWSASDDAREWTVVLRKGTRWSDGEPFDASAFIFHRQYIIGNSELTPSAPTNPYTVEAVDDYTVRFVFEDPFPLFAHKYNRGHLFAPGHYLSQFHVDLTDDKAALDKAAKDAGLSTWAELFADRNKWFLNPDRPDITPWLAKNQLSSELFSMERNPYFMGVDPEGNQLPYVDRISHRLFGSVDVFNLWLVNGEIDWQSRHVSLANYGLLKENETKGGYRVLKWMSDSSNQTLSINHDAKDPRVKEFFGDLNVRKGLNVAVDREMINEIVFDGMQTPRQASPTSWSPYYHEAASKAYAYYDPDEANAFLDAAGYTERGDDGFRLWKDGSGEQIFFTIEGTAMSGDADMDAVEMVVQYFADVGVKCAYHGEERALYTARYTANEIEAAWWGSGHETMIYLSWGCYYIGQVIDRPWAGGWGRYYHIGPDDPNASPPPEGHWLWQMWEWWDTGKMSSDEEVRKEMLRKILDVWAEQVPVVGVLGEAPTLVVVKNGLRNQVEGFFSADALHDDGLLGVPTFFWEEPDKHV